MDCSDLCSFWNQNIKAITTALPQGIQALAKALHAGADKFDLIQQVDDHFILWSTPAKEPVIMYYLIPDPRDLDRVLDAYVQTQARQCPFTAILVHQWIDGEGNWDIFLITEEWAMQHGTRLIGSHAVQERGPELRRDTYTLFDPDEAFPEPGEERWVELLDGPIEDLVSQLDALAQSHQCTQTVKEYLVQWRNPEGQLEVQFFLFPDQKDLVPFICLYRHLQQEPSPVSFVFVECEQEHLRDIFRLSARSYLEHHNRPGYRCGDDDDDNVTPQVHLEMSEASKMNEKLCCEGSKIWINGISGWSPSEKVSSVHAAIEVVGQALGANIPYDTLVGISSLAFRMQVGGLCPSSPHPACGFQCINRALRLFPRKAKAYDFDQEKRKVPEELYDLIVNSIEQGIPISTGEEEDGLVIGYDKKTRELICLHPYRHGGKQPFTIAFKKLYKLCWGIALYSEAQTPPADRKPLIVESLKQAVEMAHTETCDGYAVGLKAWEAYIENLRALEGKRKIPPAEVMGNAWIYESLVQYRGIAAEYLNQFADLFEEKPKASLLSAADIYRRLATDVLCNGKTPHDIAPPYEALKKGRTWTEEDRHQQIDMLKAAQSLEEQAVTEIEQALAAL